MDIATTKFMFLILRGNTGIYLTEHHASRLIGSVNLMFEPVDSPFPIETAFRGILNISGQTIRTDMTEQDIVSFNPTRDLPGEYSLKLELVWVGISAKGRGDKFGKPRKPRYVSRVSVCFLA